jgi:hypothetical protein
MWSGKSSEAISIASCAGSYGRCRQVRRYALPIRHEERRERAHFPSR